MPSMIQLGLMLELRELTADAFLALGATMKLP